MATSFPISTTASRLLRASSSKRSEIGWGAWRGARAPRLVLCKQRAGTCHNAPWTVRHYSLSRIDHEVCITRDIDAPKNASVKKKPRQGRRGQDDVMGCLRNLTTADRGDAWGVAARLALAHCISGI